MPTEFLPALEVAGRLLLGGVFVFAGWRNIGAFATLVPLIGARGMPMPKLMLSVAIALQVIAGVLVIAGVWLAPAAIALIGFLIVATLLFHNFWDHQGLDRVNRINGLTSNVALIGSFLLVMVVAN